MNNSHQNGIIPSTGVIAGEHVICSIVEINPRGMAHSSIKFIHHKITSATRANDGSHECGFTCSI